MIEQHKSLMFVRELSPWPLTNLNAIIKILCNLAKVLLLFNQQVYYFTLFIYCTNASFFGYQSLDIYLNGKMPQSRWNVKPLFALHSPNEKFEVSFNEKGGSVYRREDVRNDYSTRES